MTKASKHSFLPAWVREGLSTCQVLQFFCAGAGQPWKSKHHPAWGPHWQLGLFLSFRPGRGPLWLAFFLLAGSLQSAFLLHASIQCLAPKCFLVTFICIGLQKIVSFLSEEEVGGGKGHMWSLSINCEDLSIGCAAGSSNFSSAALYKGDNGCIINRPGRAPLQGTSKYKDFRD